MNEGERLKDKTPGRPRVFLVEDNTGDIAWLLDFLEARGYEVDVETNEDAARRRIEAIQRGEVAYVLAIFDIMVSVKDFMGIVELDDAFYAESRDSGVRLCKHARTVLRISEERLPIVCISARDDDELKAELRKLDIPLFDRADQTSGRSIRAYLKEHLPNLKT